MRFSAPWFLLCAALAFPPGLRAAEDAILFEPTTQIPAQGGPGVKAAYFPGGTAVLSGGIGALSLGRDFGLGVGEFSLASEYVPVHEGIKHDLGYTYGGLYLDYAVFNRGLFIVDLSMMAGPAQCWSLARAPGADRVYVNFGQIEPGVDFVLKVTHELRLSLGASWRFCAGADLDGLLGTELDGGAVTFMMMYGKI